MRTFNIVADKNLHGKTFGHFLKNVLNFSDNLITLLKKGDNTFINGVHCTVRTVINQGDNINIILPETEKSTVIPVKGSLDILYEDEDVLAVNKPHSMPTHPSKYHLTDSLANLVCGHYGEEFVFRAITRLDKDTTGIVLIAKNQYSAHLLNLSMRNNDINKEYLALCYGVLTEKTEITGYIKKETERGIKRIVSAHGNYAHTLCEPVENDGQITLVKLYPKTGRTHQLRVHMSHIGHPLCGDFLYGKKDGCEKTMLHCHKLTFNHPLTKSKITLTAPIPDEYKIKRL